MNNSIFYLKIFTVDSSGNFPKLKFLPRVHGWPEIVGRWLQEQRIVQLLSALKEAHGFTVDKSQR